MPGKIKVKVLAGRNLPVMDRAGDTTDAFVEIRFGSVIHKTDVCRKSLNPHWSSTEWYRFEVDESELQDEPLQLRLMDHDTYSANDAIGKVVISLAPLLAREAMNSKTVGATPGGSVLSGWIPVFDTMHGIRGELNVIVKVELFSDFNKYKTSSCGVQFFHCPSVPPNYKVTAIHGFVEELVVNDDPEYQWIDKIRTPRASNEARQVAFIKLSNQVQRLVGVKAAELGANAVVGYQQDFDLEGEAGVVARAIGTAVSVTPLLNAYQQLYIPAYTQQQLKKYLDILTTDKESTTDLNEYFQSHQGELQKLVNILNPKTPTVLDDPENNDDDEKCLTRQSSFKSYGTNMSIYEHEYVSQMSLKNISEDQTDLNKLLKRDDNSDSDSTGPLQKIKKIKTNLFSRKFSMRSRKSEKQDDQISIQSNSSDNSRMSLTDIKMEFKKFKKMKKPKFRKNFANKQDEGIGMASILARSVIHAHTSLACIAESQDSEHSPSSTMRRTSESEPTINMSDEDKARHEPKIEVINEDYVEGMRKVPEIKTSLKNVKQEETQQSSHIRKLSESCPATPMTTRSENLLKLPGEMGYFGSLSLSGDSSDVYTSSDEEYDESSDQKTDNETTSSVVHSVLNNAVNPVLVANMDRKLSILDGTIADPKKDRKLEDIITERFSTTESEEDNDNEDLTIQKSVASTSVMPVDTKCNIPETSSKTDDLSEVPAKSDQCHHMHFKFHNPFTHKKASKSISAPCSPTENTSFMYRSSKRIKRQLSKISNSSMIKSLSHYSLIPKKKHVASKTTLSHPGSASELQSKAPSHETVLGSPFLSYADLLTLDKEAPDVHKPLHKSDEIPQSKVKMYIGSEPVSRASISDPYPLFKEDSHAFDHKHHILHKKEKSAIKPTGLVHTAMETILIEKVQSLMVPTSPEVCQSKEKQFFEDVNEKLERVEAQHHIDNQTPKIETHKSSEHLTKEFSKSSLQEKPKKEGLVHTAVETILIDKVQSLIGPTSPEPNQQNQFFNISSHDSDTKSVQEEVQNINKHKDTRKESSLVQTAMQTMLMDRVQSLIPATAAESSEVPQHEDTGKESGLVQTAMQTMLMDRVQSLIPPAATSEIAQTDEKNIISDESRTSSKSSLTKSTSHNSLLYRAMETILIDKVQSLLPTTAETTYCHDPEESKKIDKEEKEQDSLVHSAMETILLDKVQSILMPAPVTSEPIIPIKSHTQAIPKVNEAEKVLPNDRKERKLIRQNSIECVQDSEIPESHKMSKGSNIIIPCSMSQSETTPVLQHFHPILSGAPLETIPSLPESSFDFSDSIDYGDVEKTSKCPTECDSGINNASVCDNSHAACGFYRNDRDKGDKERSDRSEREVDGEKEKEQEVEKEKEPEPEIERERERGSPRHVRHESYSGREPFSDMQQMQSASLNSTSAPMVIHRRSSDSDLSVTPKGGSLNTSCNAGSGGGAILRPSMNTNNLDMLEYPFLTMTEYPNGFIVHLGGTVCSRSVKLVDGGGESASRAAWWAELRTELRAHARALRCNAVIAYRESAAICEDVCVLSASGTAAVINLECEFGHDGADTSLSGASEPKSSGEEADCEQCSVAHVPYSPGTGPYRAELSSCGGCRRARVPAVLLATCAKPNRLQACTSAVTLTAVATRVRRAPPVAEPGARDISDQLPFLEYELHKLLLAKLRMQGANALFSLQTQIAIGERCVMALASGTAVRLSTLPPPTPPTIKASENDKEALEIQKSLWESFNANSEANGFDIGVVDPPNGSPPEPEEEEPPVLDLSLDKDACVLELDEAEDVETAQVLALRRVHMQVLTNAVKPVPCVPPYAFAQVWRKRLVLSNQGTGASMAAERQVARALDGVTYKLRRLQPCALVAPRIQIELPEDEIQLVISGTAVPLLDPNRPEENGDAEEHSVVSCHSNGYGNDSEDLPASPPPSNDGDADDDIFALDEENMAGNSQNDLREDKNAIINGQVPTMVSLTSLSYMTGSRADRRICALRLLFVRETTAVRELGGLSGFLHTFTCEVLAIVRAYTAALGGNALTSFYITQLMLQDNAHKNQGQCLLSVGGDVVQVTY